MNPTLPENAVERAPPATFYKQVTLPTGVTINSNHCTHVRDKPINCRRK